MTLVGRYVMGAALRAFLLVAAALLGLLGLLEFVEQLGLVGQGRYRVGDALLYVLLTTPGRLPQVAPLAALLGALLALSPLAARSELVAMLSLGIPARRVVAAVAVLTLPAAAALFLLAQFVIPPAQRLAQSWRADALAGARGPGGGEDGFWAQDGRQYLDVRALARPDRPVGIDLYSFAPDGSLDTLLHADHALIRPDGTWLLADVTRRRSREGGLRLVADHLAVLPWHAFLPPGEVPFLALPVRAVPPVALVRVICDLRRRHQRATPYVQELWARVSIPLSMAAMVAVAAPFVFGQARAQALGRTLARGLAVGVAFSLGQQIVGRLGLLLAVPPFLTALAPPLLVMAAAAWSGALAGMGGRALTRPAPRSPTP